MSLGFKDSECNMATIRQGCVCTRLHPHIMHPEACWCRADQWRAVDADELDMLTHKLLFALLREEEAEWIGASSIGEKKTQKPVKEGEERAEVTTCCSTSEGSCASCDSNAEDDNLTVPSRCSKMVERFPQKLAVPACALDQETLSNATNHPHNCVPCKFHCFSFNVKCNKGSQCTFCHLQHSSNRGNRKIKSRLAQGKKTKGLNSV